MLATRTCRLAALVCAAAGLVLVGTLGLVLAQDKQAADVRERPQHVPEVKALLSDLSVDKPRTHKNMVVFPLRWAGKQASGDWETLDEAVGAGHLKISEKDQASVPEVVIENTGDKAVFLMSGEIVKGGKQTRVIKKDTIIEARQKVAVPVLCVERSRWSGGKEFKSSENVAPSSIRDGMNRGYGQGQVWEQVRRTIKAAGAESATESLDEVLDSKEVKKAQEAARKDLGKFSPADTIGIAVADRRTGRVVGVEVFGRRDLFEALQDKLIEGYTTDLVIASDRDKYKPRDVTEEQVKEFIRKVLAGTSRYEDTPGSGRGIDIASGQLRGRGVALGDNVIHLSIQDRRPEVTPVRPIVDPE